MSYQTHYIPWFTTKNGQNEQTVCGKWIRPSEHSADPSCPQCRQWLEADAENDHKTAEEMFGK